MTDLRKAAEMALEALEEYCITRAITRPIASSDALRQALAQPDQEPVGWFAKGWQGVYVELMPEAADAIPLYTAPPKREWVGLTYEEMTEIWENSGWYVRLFEAVEAKLKEKNT